jgi:hypothetical protein
MIKQGADDFVRAFLQHCSSWLCSVTTVLFKFNCLVPGREASFDFVRSRDRLREANNLIEATICRCLGSPPDPASINVGIPPA